MLDHRIFRLTSIWNELTTSKGMAFGVSHFRVVVDSFVCCKAEAAWNWPFFVRIEPKNWEMAFELSVRMDRRQPAFRRGVNVLAPIHSRGRLRPSVKSGHKRNLRVISTACYWSVGTYLIGIELYLGRNRQQAKRKGMWWHCMRGKIQCLSVSNIKRIWEDWIETHFTQCQKSVLRMPILSLGGAEKSKILNY